MNLKLSILFFAVIVVQVYEVNGDCYQIGRSDGESCCVTLYHLVNLITQSVMASTDAIAAISSFANAASGSFAAATAGIAAVAQETTASLFGRSIGRNACCRVSPQAVNLSRASVNSALRAINESVEYAKVAYKAAQIAQSAAQVSSDVFTYADQLKAKYCCNFGFIPLEITAALTTTSIVQGLIKSSAQSVFDLSVRLDAVMLQVAAGFQELSTFVDELPNLAVQGCCSDSAFSVSAEVQRVNDVIGPIQTELFAIGTSLALVVQTGITFTSTVGASYIAILNTAADYLCTTGSNCGNSLPKCCTAGSACCSSTETICDSMTKVKNVITSAGEVALATKNVFMTFATTRTNDLAAKLSLVASVATIIATGVDVNIDNTECCNATITVNNNLVSSATAGQSAAANAQTIADNVNVTTVAVTALVTAVAAANAPINTLIQSVNSGSCCNQTCCYDAAADTTPVKNYTCCFAAAVTQSHWSYRAGIDQEIDVATQMNGIAGTGAIAALASADQIKNAVTGLTTLSLTLQSSCCCCGQPQTTVAVEQQTTVAVEQQTTVAVGCSTP